MYEQRVHEVECGSFTPLVFSALGGPCFSALRGLLMSPDMSEPTEITYKRLASLLATKKDQHYNTAIL